MFIFDSKKFPDSPGIYLFYNDKRELIYVGKATSLKDRVASYFRNPLPTSPLKMGRRPIELLINEVSDVKIIQTESVLEAIILEANTIKKFQPKYNVDLKDDKSWNYIVMTKENYPQVKTVRQHEIENSKFDPRFNRGRNLKFKFGPYPGLKTREMMKLLQRLFFISHCKPCQPGKPCRPCLYYAMEQCLGVCTGEITSQEYKKKVIRPLVMFLRGNKKGVIRQLGKQMKEESKKENFEEAGRLRNQISALQRIQDIALLNKSFTSQQKFEIRNSKFEFSRIEGYDISNLGEAGKVGSMVVFENSESNKSQYRKFKIKNVLGQSDVGCLHEVLERRLKHSEWRMPNVILVDGGVPQVNRTVETIRVNKFKIPVVGIAKGPKRKKNEFILGSKEKEFVKWVNKNQELLVRVRDEAHRFAISYQRKLRKIKH